MPLSVVVGIGAIAPACGGTNSDVSGLPTAVETVGTETAGNGSELLTSSPSTSESVPGTTSDAVSATSVVADDVAQVVAITLEDLKFTEAAQLGTDVIANNVLNEQINACVNERGYQYRGQRVFGVEGRRPDDQNIYFGGVSAFWHMPPRVDAARTFGLRGNSESPSSVSDLPASDVRSDLKPPTDDGYPIVEQDCTNQFPTAAEVPGLDVVQMLDAEIHQISRDTQQLDGFRAISDEYQACVNAAGHAFTDPSELFSLEHPASYTGDPTAFDNEIAVVDAECRVPLYAAFIDLNAAAWTEWLARREGDIATAVAAAAEYERAAVAAWVG